MLTIIRIVGCFLTLRCMCECILCIFFIESNNYYPNLIYFIVMPVAC